MRLAFVATPVGHGGMGNFGLKGIEAGVTVFWRQAYAEVGVEVEVEVHKDAPVPGRESREARGASHASCQLGFCRILA
jgi:hypothetical protein